MPKAAPTEEPPAEQPGATPVEPEALALPDKNPPEEQATVTLNATQLAELVAKAAAPAGGADPAVIAAAIAAALDARNPRPGTKPKIPVPEAPGYPVTYVSPDPVYLEGQGYFDPGKPFTTALPPGRAWVAQS